MNEITISKLVRLADDEKLLEAIAFAFEERIEKEKPTDLEKLNNKELGEQYRAYIKAKNMLSKIMVDLSSYTTQKVDPGKFNKGK